MIPSPDVIRISDAAPTRLPSTETALTSPTSTSDVNSYPGSYLSRTAARIETPDRVGSTTATGLGAVVAGAAAGSRSATPHAATLPATMRRVRK